MVVKCVDIDLGTLFSSLSMHKGGRRRWPDATNDHFLTCVQGEKDFSVEFIFFTKSDILTPVWQQALRIC